MTKKFTWEDVSIEQFHQILAIMGMKKSELDKAIDVLSVLSGETSENYKNMPLEVVTDLLRKIEGLTAQNLKPRFIGGTYVVEGTTYLLTPCAEKMTAGQFIDYQLTLEKNPDDVALLCAVLLVPKGKKYGEGYDVMELRQTLYDKFPYIDSMGISFFAKEIRRVVRLYSLLFNQENEERTEEGKGSPEDTDPGEGDRRDKESGRRDSAYVWDSVIRQIVQAYNVDKYQVFEMSLVEFLNDATTCKREVLRHNKQVEEKIKQMRKGRKGRRR